MLAQQRAEGGRAARGGGARRRGGGEHADVERLQDALLGAQRDVGLLEDENASLKEELSALTPEFFEEIENLKFRYQEAIAENDRLRERVRRG